jgi:hypothetical protein
MSWPASKSRAAWKTSRRCAAFTACALLLASAIGGPPASASLVGEVAGAAGSVVESATGTPAPSVPSTPPPAPSTPPPPQQVPVNPVKAPTEAASTYSPGAASDAAATSGADDAPAVERLVDGAGESPASAGEAPTEASSVPVPAGSPPQGARRNAPSSPRGRGHRPALIRATPVGWLLAYVWPAIALDRSEQLLTAVAAGSKGAGLLPAVLEAVGMPPGQGGRTQVNSPSPPRERFAMPNSSAGSPALKATLAEGAKTLLYTAVAALLALFAFTVWTELRAAVRSRSALDR